MGNLIRAEFYRIRCQRWGVLALAGVLLGGVLLLAAACALPPQRGDAALLFQTMEYSAILGMFFAMLCADLASARVNGKQVLLKNEAVFGISRWQMYLSRLCTAVLLGIALVLAMTLLALVLTLLFLPGLEELPGVLSQYALLMFTALPLWMASAGLFLCLKFVCRSGAMAGFLQAAYYFIGFPILGAVVTSVPRGGGDGFLGSLLYNLHPMTPFWNGDMVVEHISTGVSITMDPESFVDAPPPLLHCWALGAVWLIASSALAVWVLQRRELR